MCNADDNCSYPLSASSEGPRGDEFDDDGMDSSVVPYPKDVNAIMSFVGRVTATHNPAYIAGVQSRHFSVRTACYDPEAEGKSREFTLECMCPNTRRWEIARGIIPPVGALVFVYGQLIGTYENGRVVLPAVEVLELSRLPSSATTIATVASSTGAVSTSSPTTNRVLKNFSARTGGKKARGNPDTTPLPLSFTPTSPSKTKRARAPLPSASQMEPDLRDAQLGNSGGSAAVPLLVSDNSSATSTIVDDSLDDSSMKDTDDARRDKGDDSDTSFVSISHFRK